jgi:protein TonB
VAPVHPANAIAAGIYGAVIVEIVVDSTGKVSEARVIRSLPLLDQAAIDCVRQWEFSPALLNGLATPMRMAVTVQFPKP